MKNNNCELKHSISGNKEFTIAIYNLNLQYLLWYNVIILTFKIIKNSL
jgi:hypothetical protein